MFITKLMLKATFLVVMLRGVQPFAPFRSGWSENSAGWRMRRSSTSISMVQLRPETAKVLNNIKGVFSILSDSTQRKYVFGTGLRVSWFMGQFLYQQAALNNNTALAAPILTALAQVTSKQITGSGLSKTGSPPSSATMTEEQRLAAFREEFFTAFVKLFEQDFRNIEEGHYKLPYDLTPSLSSKQWNPFSILQTLQIFQEDAKVVRVRRQIKDGLEVARGWQASVGRYPDYYLQNFHYQTDGWLSPQSAALYDYQVESLFFGCGDMMRRQILPSFGRYRRSIQGRLEHLDMACGTGRFASFLLDNHPDISCTLQDLSPFYLADAEKNVKSRFPQAQFVEAAAEQLPFADNSFDSITCVYLFHELPAEVRKQVVREMHRVLRPGGKVFFVDSAQKDDVSYAQVFQGFAGGFHEPYYLNYVETNLRELFGEAGLAVEEEGVHWLSKSLVAVKSPSAVAPVAAATTA